MDRLTVYDLEHGRYKTRADSKNFFLVRELGIVADGVYTQGGKCWIFGDFVDKLAEYENAEGEKPGIKNCPCCGGSAKYEIKRVFDGKESYLSGSVACQKCEISTPKFAIDGYYGEKYTAEEIICIWNRRATNNE